MTIVAQAHKGQEYMYTINTAHKVSAEKANKIAELLNQANYMLPPDKVWFVYEVDRYDTAYDYAQFQRFEYGKRGLIRRY